MGYNIQIQYGNFEGEWCYQAHCTEFPDLFDYGDSREEALALIKESIEITIKELEL